MARDGQGRGSRGQGQGRAFAKQTDGRKKNDIGHFTGANYNVDLSQRAFVPFTPKHYYLVERFGV